MRPHTPKILDDSYEALGVAAPIRTKPSWYPLKKRAFDLSLTLLAMPVWLPLLALVLAVVKLADPLAPALFRQSRTGLNGVRFEILKVRTMVPGADQAPSSRPTLRSVRETQHKSRLDPRVTIGRSLRSTHLDELPQLFNVLRGEIESCWASPEHPAS